MVEQSVRGPRWSEALSKHITTDTVSPIEPSVKLTGGAFVVSVFPNPSSEPSEIVAELDLLQDILEEAFA